MSADPEKNWSEFYGRRFAAPAGRYPTEWVVRTLAGGRYPNLQLDKTRYQGAKILDMGCGDGRNLSLLLDLGFDVTACEISAEIVGGLKLQAKEMNWPIDFAVGNNTSLPFPDQHFDYMLCCSSCYYLDGETIWSDVRSELSRVLKPDGLLVANFPDEKNAVLANAVRHKDGSLLITSDPFSLRNGSRFVAVNQPAELPAVLGPEFTVIGVAHQNDDFFGLHVSGYAVVAKKI